MRDYVIKHREIIPKDTRSTISMRYKNITSAINREFWNSNSDSLHSLYVGSYGRGTAVDTSDIDVLVELPESEYYRYDVMKGNGQSRLLQVVKNAIQISYPCTDVRADGQVVKLLFSDDMKIEVLPAFVVNDWWAKGTYKYPDTNMGGNWRSTDPRAEQKAMRLKNESSNGLLFDTCKHIRYIRDNYFSSYHLSGIAIDSFIYSAIGDWHWTDPSNSSGKAAWGEYESQLYNQFLLYCKYNKTISAPGSGQDVDFSSSVDCLEKVLLKMKG